VARRLQGNGFQVLDGVRTFIREGDLLKTCRSGKKILYRFFLFSDMLVYAHSTAGSSEEYKVLLKLSVTATSSVCGSLVITLREVSCVMTAKCSYRSVQLFKIMHVR
jgi:hypothetical protein